METWIVHYTAEKLDQCTDLEHEVKVPNIDFVIPTFRNEVRLFKKIEAIIKKTNDVNKISYQESTSAKS